MASAAAGREPEAAAAVARRVADEAAEAAPGHAATTGLSSRRRRPRRAATTIASAAGSGAESGRAMDGIASEYRARGAALSADTPAWVRDAVFYQIFPDRFARSARLAQARVRSSRGTPRRRSTGSRAATCSAIAERLADLDDLGITALYLTPIFASASNHRYHTYDYLAVDPLLGGDAALRELLDAAHDRGMRVILDGVFNHIGRGFWPFHHVLENGAASPYRDWFHLDPAVARRAGRPAERLSRPRAAPDATRRSATRPGGACRRCRSSTPTHPDVREYLLGRRRALAPLRHRRLAARRPGRDRRPRRSGRSSGRAAGRSDPDAYLVGEIWDDGAGLAPGRPVRRPDELPARPRRSSASPAAASSTWRSSAATTSIAATSGRSTDRRFAARARRAAHDVYDPEVVAVQLNLLGSHDTPRLRDRPRRRPRPASGWRCCSR